jgi:hypothetical protein
MHYPFGSGPCPKTLKRRVTYTEALQLVPDLLQTARSASAASPGRAAAALLKSTPPLPPGRHTNPWTQRPHHRGLQLRIATNNLLLQTARSAASPGRAAAALASPAPTRCAHWPSSAQTCSSSSSSSDSQSAERHNSRPTTQQQQVLA